MVTEFNQSTCGCTTKMCSDINTIRARNTNAKPDINQQSPDEQRSLRVNDSTDFN